LKKAVELTTAAFDNNLFFYIITIFKLTKSTTLLANISCFKLD